MDNRSKVWIGMGLLLVAAAFFGGWLMFAPVGKGPAEGEDVGGGALRGVGPLRGATPAARGVGGVAMVGPPPVNVVGLKDAFFGKVRVGTAVDVSAGGRPAAQLSERELALVRENFNVLVPENCMKPQPIHPAEATWSFEPADQFMEFAAANGLQVVGHVLVWHSQTPNWFFQGDGATEAGLTERLKTHIQTLVGRYKGKVMGWNVVNEPINDGNGSGENLRNSNWLRILGPDYIGMAFRFAHEADPGAKLFLNDYNIEKGAKHDASMALLRRLKSEGVPVDGIGIQGHWSATSATLGTDLEKAVVDYQSLGLKVALSELDITGPTAARAGAAPAAPAADAPDPQVEAYRQVMKVVLAHREAFSHVIFYGLDDKRSWRSGQKPTLFDAEGQTKPAWQAVMELGKGG